MSKETEFSSHSNVALDESAAQCFLGIPGQEEECVEAEAAQVRVSPINGSKKRSLQPKCSCKQVLLVNDEEFNIKKLSYYITECGLNVTTAYNGEEAIFKLRDQIERRCSDSCSIFRVILMDIQMPIMDGWEAVKQMRNLQKQLGVESLYIIAVAVFFSTADQIQSIQCGFDRVINIQTEIKHLRDVLNQYRISTSVT